VIAALVEAFNKNGGLDGKFGRHVDEFVEVLYRFEVRDYDNARYYLTEAIWNDDGLTDELISETISVLRENDYEAKSEAYDDYGDFDGYYGKQYYQNPNGVCEDAPCCGCCGMM